MGLYYLKNRYYDPMWGRFINADTIMGEVGKILDHNVFSYCKQNPVASIDPDGMLATTAYMRMVKRREERAAAVETYYNTALDVYQNGSYNPGTGLRRKGTDKWNPVVQGGTYCNLYAMMLAEALGIKDFSKIGQGHSLANDIYDKLYNGRYAGWKELDSEAMARSYANGGYFTIANWRNDDGEPGHVQVIIPSTSSATAYAQYGSVNFFGGGLMVKKVPPEHDYPIRFYVYIGQ